MPFNYLSLIISGAKIGNRLYSCGFMHIRNYNRHNGITIGDDVSINSCMMANPIGGGDKTIMFAAENGAIHISDGVKMSNTTFFSTIGISVGEGTFIGGGTRIYDTDFHSLLPEYRLHNSDESLIASKPVVIGKNVFIGSNAQILKGVHIGDESVIGAGSVVTKDIPKGEIWGGNPAKFIRKLRNE